ncbi:MAG TPA: 4-hydroxybenzoate octaprenyltransferase, partial [Stellaceae bacterium]|nr:4-hydroxybenzoate octaprenyltransferase [Stellaceae bacterium]
MNTRIDHNPAPGFTDIRTSRLDRLLPAAAIPYTRLARLDRPTGWWLLLLPCWWALALASPRHPDPVLFLLFWLGAVAMRGAGCTLNDIFDRNFDAQVERTRSRPIPSGQVTVPQAILFMAAEAAIGAAVLFSLNRTAILLGFAILVVVAVYPLMKRVTFWPQFVLGLAFNWGAILGWAASAGRVEAPAVLLYLGGIAWTLGYDTIYAHQDKADDVGAGVRSTALRLAGASKTWIAGFYAVAVAFVGGALFLAGSGPWGYAVLALAAGHFAWQLATWRPDDRADCLAKFKSNRIAGLLIAAACLV